MGLFSKSSNEHQDYKYDEQYEKLIASKIKMMAEIEERERRSIDRIKEAENTVFFEKLKELLLILSNKK